MAGIRSTLGTTKGTGTSMPNFRVEDETEALDEISKPLPAKAVQQPQEFKSYEEVQRFREQHTSQPSVAPDARKRIELLLGIGKLNKEVVVGSGKEKITFSLRTLKNKENASLIGLGTRVQDGDIKAFLELKINTLAFAIESVEGIPLDVFLGLAGQTEEDKLAIKLGFFDDMETSIVSHLYEEFSALSQESGKQYGITTLEDAEQVSGDLKK